MRRTGHPTPLNVALEGLLARREARARTKERLAALVWGDCVGPFYAARTHVTGVSRGTMYVWCNSPALAHQLSLDAEEIAGRLNTELAGEYIKEIRPTTTGRRRRDDAAEERGPRLPSATRRELEAIRLLPGEVAVLEAGAARIADEGLRRRFLDAALAQRRVQKWRKQHGYAACSHCGWLIPPTMSHCTKCGRERQ